ncbi:sugar phosphate isomerase/epimerase [Paenibacillus frigoriresistens]|uniref:sugar phosphate isomerase/epimerase family protein n=1 Tax=Paenibacillus alginolyticus TaxID=59839 RepID=UPI0015645E2D|nr:sugar phosphate isomerase/epimerase [Paenibacillus frigoriresistens]NRF96133.1 sugar phosphate isomerase/epimerase [Paenibacillus frigoriresistens]
MTIRLAFSRPTTVIEEQIELFDNFSKLGYDGLQLKFSQYAPYLNDPERFLEQWGHLKGVGSALIIGGNLDPQNIELLRNIYGFARRIGSEKIVYCHGISRKDVNNHDIIEYANILSELGKEAEQMGIKLSLHHHYDQPVMYRDDFDLFFENVKDCAVGLTVDTAHLVKSGIGDVAEIITSFRDVIDNFHMKDFADGDWRVLGEGMIDFIPIFQAIRSTKYDGWISADEESGGEIYKGMVSCLSYMKSGLCLT